MLVLLQTYLLNLELKSACVGSSNWFQSAKPTLNFYRSNLGICSEHLTLKDQFRSLHPSGWSPFHAYLPLQYNQPLRCAPPTALLYALLPFSRKAGILNTGSLFYMIQRKITQIFFPTVFMMMFVLKLQNEITTAPFGSKAVNDHRLVANFELINLHLSFPST